MSAIIESTTASSKLSKSSTISTISTMKRRHPTDLYQHQYSIDDDDDVDDDDVDDQASGYSKGHQRLVRIVVSIGVCAFVWAAFVSEYNLLEQHYFATAGNPYRDEDRTLQLQRVVDDNTDTNITSSSLKGTVAIAGTEVIERFKVTVGSMAASAAEATTANNNNDTVKTGEKTNLRGITIPTNIAPEKQSPVPPKKFQINPDDNALYKYMKTSPYPHLFTIIIWDKTGKLQRTSPSSIAGWFPHKSHKMFDNIAPTKFGRVALLLNSNVLDVVYWDTTPPVPVLTYTIPSRSKSKNNDNNFYILPTPYDRDGYTRACIQHAEEVKIPFEKRKNIILWRGGTHLISNRLKLIELSKKTQQDDPKHIWLDAQSVEKEESKSRMERPKMAEYKYQLDIGGASGTAWDSLRWKMCSGNLVFKVNTWSEDWWHDTIEPWKHYVPVKKDLSDLHEQYLWAESHPHEVLEIVKHGRAVCKQSVTENAVTSYQRKVLLSLQPETSNTVILQANDILDGLGAFWKNASADTAFNRTKMEEHQRRHVHHPDTVGMNGTTSTTKTKGGSEPGSDSTDGTRTQVVKKPIVQSPVIPKDANESTSVIRYLEKSNYPHMITLLKWNASGILDGVSPIDVPTWLPKRELRLFQQTKASKHGTVAFLLNTDVLAAVRWDVLPPIPLITYSLPNQCKMNNTNNNNKFFLAPNPYDRGSFNRACISHAEQVTLHIPFMERKNVIIWRGIPHGESDKNRYTLFEMSENDPDNTWLDAVNVEIDKKKYMQRDEMSEYKYQLDIGGESGTTWGSLRWKMCSGNLVFKVNSWSQDWWHDTIEPWKHYIPVKEDLSDLREQYEWAEKHPKEVLEIVKRGTDTCKKSVTDDAVKSYQQRMIQSLPAATESHIKEVTAILNGLGSFYQLIIDNKTP